MNGIPFLFQSSIEEGTAAANVARTNLKILSNVKSILNRKAFALGLEYSILKSITTI